MIHLRTVRGQTPTASARDFGVCPEPAWPTTHSRPRGVKRAFLWTFIRLLLWKVEVSQPHLPRLEPDGQPIESSQPAGESSAEYSGSHLGLRRSARWMPRTPARHVCFCAKSLRSGKKRQ